MREGQGGGPRPWCPPRRACAPRSAQGAAGGGGGGVAVAVAAAVAVDVVVDVAGVVVVVVVGDVHHRRFRWNFFHRRGASGLQAVCPLT